MSIPLVSQSDPAFGEPTWEIAHLFPAQGTWDEEDYLDLETNRLVELSDGDLEVLPMPTEEHQSIVFYLWQVVHQFATAGKLGKVLGAPLRVRLWEDKFREPDVVFMLEKNKHRRKGKYWEGADLVMEVVSEDDPDRDLKKKRAEYAKAGILEYWIVDPRDATVTVLSLGEGESEYTVAGTYGRGEAAASRLLSGLSIDVDAVFSQA